MTTVHLQTQQTVTAATASTGVDISSSTYGFPTGVATGTHIAVRVYGLDYGDTATIQIDVSTDGFSAFETVASWTAYGPIGATSNQGDQDDDEGYSTAFYQNPVTFGIGARECGGIPWGVSGAIMRVNVSSLTGSSPHLTYEAWFTF